MKLMCVYEGWWPDNHPHYGDVCHATYVYYDEAGAVNAYDLQEYPCPRPYRWGAWHRGPGGRLCPNFIEIEESEHEESEPAEVPQLELKLLNP